MTINKKIIIPVVAVIVVALGFYLGRLTAPPIISITPIGEEIPTVTTSEFPTPPETTEYVPSQVTSENDALDLVVETPAEQAATGAEFVVTGRARTGAVIKGDLKAVADGTEVWSDETNITADDGAEFGRFSLTAVAPEGSVGEFILTVSRFSDDGTVTDTVTRDVSLGLEETVRVKVYFQPANIGELTDCGVVEAVERVVSRDNSIYRAAIEELLKGPSDDETSRGLASSLPDGVKLKSVAADAAGVVTVDFSAKLDKNVAGSCRVGAIRSQIEKTILQFPEARGVIIAVEGRIDGVLQP